MLKAQSKDTGKYVFLFVPSPPFFSFPTAFIHFISSNHLTLGSIDYHLDRSIPFNLPNRFVAIKKMKARFESMEQVNNLREVQALRRLSPHAHVIKLIEIIFEKATGTLALVFELMEMNLYEMIKGRRTYLPERLIKSVMWQLLKATDHMHRNGIFHRDIKPENVLIRDERVKLCDFGSCRGIRSKQPFTEYISTRWYRAPEVR